MRAFGLVVLAISALVSSPVLAEPVAVTGGTVHPVDGPAIENGVLLFEGGVITAVGGSADVSVPPDARRVDATGQHVWPGLIDGLSYLGLTEIGSVRGTIDYQERGAMNPNTRAEVAINASSSHFPVTRANGVLLAATLPRGSKVPGTAAAIALHGWTWEEVVRRAPTGLVVEWPAMMTPERGATIWGEKSSKPEEWEAEVAQLDEMIVEARAYRLARDSGPEQRDADVRWESLTEVTRGRVPVWIHARSLPQIRAALDWTAKHELSMVLIDGNSSAAGDSPLCAEEIATRDVPVIVQTTRRPTRRYEPYDAAYTSPARLHAAGVRIAFGTWSSSNARNLPQEASRAVAYGLPREAAEHALTLGAAEILGIGDRYGSLTRGKSATFLIVDGDLLETRMQVRGAWIDGEEVSLESRHTDLWKRWSARPMPRASR